MNHRAEPMLADPLTTPLEELDVSDPKRFEYDCWQPLFKRLREESPVHFQADSPAGPFWSITRFDDIVEVEKILRYFRLSPR